MYSNTVTSAVILIKNWMYHIQSLILAQFMKYFFLASRALPPPTIRKVDCPYEYLLHTYGTNHFQKIIDFLTPELRAADVELHGLVLEVLDTVHLGAILVDDVADNSMLRKGEIAAHRIYGSSETINRAYLVIFNATVKCQHRRPDMVPFIFGCIAEIHQGIAFIQN